MQCTILNAKLNHLNEWNKKRKKIANIYNCNLKNIKEIKLLEYDKSSVYHLYVIRLKNRNKFVKYMNKKKIECGYHYPYTLYKNYNTKIKLKNSETLSKECVSLPMHPNLKKKEIYKIIEAIKNFK